MTRYLRTLRAPGRVLLVAAILLIASGAVFGVVRYSKKEPDTPTFQVRQAEFLDVIQFHGTVKAMHSITISAPAEAGDLQIVKLAASGTQVQQGDVVVEFDKSKTVQDLAKYQSVLKSSQAEIDQERAQDVLKEEEDVTAVMKAEYDVNAAKLEASKKEIVSQIDGLEANLRLADAQQKLHEMREKLKADRALDLGTVEGKKEASKKADYDAQTANRALGTMQLKAPSAGVVSLISVWHSGDETPFKAGERAWPGAPIAELPDASTLRVAARVDETERGRLALQQPVTVQFDAIPDHQFNGKVTKIGTIASMDFSAGWPFPRNFNLEITLDDKDPRLKPGMTAQATVVVDRIPNALAIPAQAMFQKSGQTLTYVWNGSKYREQPIAVGRTSRDRILVVQGLNPGDRIALKDPTVKE